MTTQSFYRAAMETSGEANREAAKRGTAAVLQAALGDRLTADEADRVVAQPPWGLTEIWEGAAKPERRTLARS